MSRRIQWPLTRSGRALATIDADSLASVGQCVHLLTRTPLGARPLVPEIGFEDPTFVGMDESIIDDLAEWEPRAALEVQVITSDDGSSQTRRVTVSLADQQIGWEV